MTAIREMAPGTVVGELHRYRLIDVREPAELVGDLGHIEGAQNLPLGQLDQHAPELAQGGPILFICRSGRRSYVACEKLVALGHSESVNLEGGMIAWNEAGLGVVSAPAPEKEGPGS